MSSEASDGTGAGLLAFLDWAGKRGEINPSTAKLIAVAVGKVLAVEADSDRVDITTIDPEDLFDRFETLNRTGYSTDSLNTYRSRFMRGLFMYRAWLNKRSDWKAAGLRNSSKANAPKPTSNGNKTTQRPRSKKPSSAPPSGAAAEVIDPPSAAQTLAMVPYDLPLRPGLRVRLVLPEMLTQADAKRIAAFVDSLAFDQADVSREGE